MRPIRYFSLIPSSFRWGLLLVLALVPLSACAPNAPPKTISMRVAGAPPSAVVYIDGAYIGPFSMVAHRGVALPVGKHRISVEKEGFFPWDEVVEVGENSPPVHLRVVLRRIPD